MVGIALNADEVVIREFERKDLNGVIAINRSCLPENYPPYFFLENYRNYPKAFLVAEKNGEIVGYIMCRVEYGFSHFSRKLVKRGHIISIAVIPRERRKGIGGKLMIKAMEAMKNHYSVSEYFLEVRVSNFPAINLYKKLGFQIVRVIPNYYLDGENAYLMAKKAIN